MSIVSAFSTGISGLEANSDMLSTVSDNIVNANTVGFKSARTEFQTILSEDVAMASGYNQLGRGVSVAGITNLFTQGALTKTDRATDLAISGNGFFVLKGDHFGYSYTRDGQFRFDKQGWLTNMNGSRIQAFQADPDGKIGGKIGDLRLSYNTLAAKATKKIDLHVNLDAREAPNALFDIKNPDKTAQFSTALQIHDSVGNEHSLSVYFNKNKDAVWEWHAMVDGGDVQGGTSGVPVEMAKGTVMFDETGRLKSVQQQSLKTTFVGGSLPNQEIELNFGDPLDQNGTGASGSTQYGAKSGTFRNIQDGFASGSLVDTSIDPDGVLTGVYSNGQMKVLGQIALARFEATERLDKVGGNQYRESSGSGSALIGKANTNGRGAMVGKSVEQSNVDLAKELVDLIRAQRGFQASTKSISAANDALEQILNIKRG